ncbi:MAG: transketolase C-terminal domain-containing protein [candidate division Zixibacteria bacterium]
MRKLIEGSMAVAELVKLCRPNVIAAYPITPQTHIVENLSQFVADGELKGEFLNVESEFGAASVVLGASAAGARSYSTTTSQGLLLMGEVLYNISGLRLPVVITCANRAISAPINIWNDHSDAMTVRDAGWIMLFAEDNQEAADMHPQAYKIGEDPNICLPVLINMDGFILTHAFEPVDIPDQKEVDDYLPKYKPSEFLTVKDPRTFGMLAEPQWYAETRYKLFETHEDAKQVIEKTADDFKDKFGRYYGGLIDTYRLDDAERAFVAMGSLIGTLKDVVDDLRDKGEKVGILKIRSFRPFPKEKIREVCADVKELIVTEKAFSFGLGGVLQEEIRAAFYKQKHQPTVSGFVLGLGGRDIPPATLINIYNGSKGKEITNAFVDLRPDIAPGPFSAASVKG